ncbi:ABC transporter permease [Alicyclobacillus fastidiosus]|uniref:ABC transporter permease n=1 Tax=Alicyclobacillus fastidiosus TaxID=392011 RepID=A0ABY6ZN60_9BACL|nr:ABC transporter permease [Alicyclobacillus fastidiosus]WAH44398.1 ABC transporter permease [Alicyclobacillus fastidiosus]GMA60736.1 ribose ABC transporter permease [Alicyclobacillus fastidiosus]
MSVEGKIVERGPSFRIAIEKWIGQYGIYIPVVILLIVGPVVSGNFYTLTNLVSIIDSISLLGIVALGVAFVTYSGNYADMSIPSIMAFSGIVSISTLRFGIVVSLVLGILAGLVIGAINGLVVGKIKANPIIWTLAVEYVLLGVMQWAWGGKQVFVSSTTPAINDFFQLSRANLWGRIPLVFVIWLVFGVVTYILMTHSKFGRRLKLVGSSRDVASTTGINVTSTIFLAFLLSALGAAIGGILLTSLVKLGVYYNGTGYDFNSVTAVVIGGITLAGGRGNIIGVFGGVLVIGLLANVLTLLGMSEFMETIVQGIIFILVVFVNAYSLRRSGRDDS